MADKGGNGATDSNGQYLRTVPADAVEYHIYIDPSSPIASQPLETFAASCRTHLAPLLTNYLWQREPFILREWPVATNPNEPPHIWGRTAFGDNIEDEWFIVHCLRSLSAAFPAISIRVEDSDGQFLLIEAADHLPSWLQPDTAQHRVWLRGGRLHIIPRPPRAPRTPAELVARSSIHPLIASCGSSKLTRDIALQVLRTPDIDSYAVTVESAVNRRLADFPRAAIEANNHNVRVLIPLTGARVLQQQPQLIARAVESFYLRDPIDMKACNKMARFLPLPAATTPSAPSPATPTPSSSSSSSSSVPASSGEVPMVWTKVRFTRCLYAQLNSQNFHPPKSYRMPSDIRHAPLDDRRRLAAELGLKLVCGLEILYQNQLRAHATRAKKRAAEAALKEQRRAREARGGIAAPKDEPLHPADIEDDTVNLAATIDTILGVPSIDEKKGAWPPSSIDVTYGWNEFKQSYDQLGRDDSDDWMTITPQQIDDIFAQRNQPPRVHIDGKAVTRDGANGDDHKRGAGGKPSGNGEEMDLNTLVDSMSAFVEKVSGHRGATVPSSAAATAAKGSTTATSPNGIAATDDNDEPEIEVNFENVMKMLAASAPSATTSSGAAVANKPASRPRQTHGSDSDDDDDDGTDTDGERDPLRRRHEYIRGGMDDNDDDGDMDQLDDHEADDDDVDIDDDMYRDDDIDDESHAGLSSLSLHDRHHHTNGVGNGDNGMRHPGREPQLMDYMQQMDRELRQAGIGGEFARASSSSAAASSSRGNGSNGAGVAPSKRPSAPPNLVNDSDDDNDNDDNGDNDDDNEDDDVPVDPKFNLVANMLQSYNAQSGTAGPAGNLLASLGIRLPDNSDASSALASRRR